MTPDPCLLRFRREGAPRLRLVCFPFAGGSPGFFRPWQARWLADVEVVALQLPGRGARFLEAPHARLAPMLDAIVPSILALADRPFAFFGHSMGALVAFELVRRLRALGAPMPVQLFASASAAPELRVVGTRWHALPDAELITRLRQLGGTPEEALRDHELMQLMIPLLRADFALLETHRHERQAPLDVPIDAFGGVEDHAVPAASLDAWRASTTTRFTRRMYPGGHFYLQGAREALLDDVAARLNEHLQGREVPVRRPPPSVRDLRELRAS